TGVAPAAWTRWNRGSEVMLPRRHGRPQRVGAGEGGGLSSQWRSTGSGRDIAGNASSREQRLHRMGGQPETGGPRDRGTPGRAVRGGRRRGGGRGRGGTGWLDGVGPPGGVQRARPGDRRGHLPVTVSGWLSV